MKNLLPSIRRSGGDRAGTTAIVVARVFCNTGVTAVQNDGHDPDSQLCFAVDGVVSI
jgi:hypothetical protein